MLELISINGLIYKLRKSDLEKLNKINPENTYWRGNQLERTLSSEIENFLQIIEDKYNPIGKLNSEYNY